jgi:hypothetical protein
MATITLEKLKALGVCPPAAYMFTKLFGDHTELSVESCIAVADHFNWDWAAQNLLNDHKPFWPAIKPAKQAHEGVVQHHDSILKATVKPHRDAYHASQSNSGAFEAAVKPLQDAYEAAIVSSRHDFNVARATAFAKLYLSQVPN